MAGMEAKSKWSRFSLKALFLLVAFAATYFGGYQHGRRRQDSALREEVRLRAGAEAESQKLRDHARLFPPLNPADFGE